MNPRLAKSIAQLSDGQPIPDHADALASILEHYAQLVRAGVSTEDLANRLIPILRVAARRT